MLKNQSFFSIVAVISVLLCTSVRGAVSVKVFSRDEALRELNISKPRIYIQNTGTEPVSGICYYYYFQTENGNSAKLG